MHDAHTPPTGYFPQTQGAIVTATEQAPVVRRERQTGYISGMPQQHCSRPPVCNIPDPNRPVSTATSKCLPITTPGYTIHPIRMPCERQVQMSAGQLPQLDCTIPAPTGEEGSRRGQRPVPSPISYVLKVSECW